MKKNLLNLFQMQNVYIIGSLFLLSILSGLLYYNTVLVDTQAYVPSVYYLQGKELLQEDVTRVTVSYAFKRPVEIFAAAVLEPVVGVRQAYSLINLFLYCASTVLFYWYLKKFFEGEEKKEQHAYVGAVLYAVSLPLILYATRVLVDVAGYVTIILGLLLLDYIIEKKWQWHLALALVFGFFLLVRDAVVILFPVYFFMLLKKEFSIKTKKLFLFAVVLCLAFLPEFLFMHIAGVGSVLAGKGAAITPGKYSLLGWLKFFIVHVAAFHLGYVFAVIGWTNERKEEKMEENESNKKNRQRIFFYKAYGISVLLYLVGIQLVALTSPRFSMVLFPLLLPLAAQGIEVIAEKYKEKVSPAKIIFGCILFYAFFSFLGAWLYPGRTVISEDAGGTAVVHAVIEEIKIKLAVLFS